MTATLPTARPAINPRMIHVFFVDLSWEEQAQIRTALGLVPGEDTERAAIWERFERNEATALLTRNEAGGLSSFTFFEERHHRDGTREFFISAAAALQPSHDLTETSFPQFERFARILKCGRIAFQTPRPGLARKVLKMPGWELRPGTVNREMILQKKL